MKNKIFYSVLLLALCMMLPKTANAQKYIIQKTNGEQVVYDYADVESIIFSDAQDGYEFVDLGLSVKWATRNVGAEKPEDSGSFFSWGEMEAKEFYNMDTYIYGYYDEDEYYQYKALGNISGNEKYDVAKSVCGDAARIPTMDEIEELCNKCNWAWKTVNGVLGVEFTGPNGNSIFLPASGGHYGKSYIGANESGRYWCATPSDEDVADAYILGFDDDEEDDEPWIDLSRRYNGLTIRPVSE